MRYNLTSTFQKVLGLQSALKPHLLNPFSFRGMSSSTSLSPSQNPDVSRILTYWFPPPPSDPVKKWFGGGPTVDEEIKSQFLPIIQLACSSKLDTWKTEPASTLALLILLDQFPRNIFRGTPDSFSSDGLALETATEAIAKGFDQEVSHIQKAFFYMPLMHAEDLVAQVACVSLMELVETRCEEGTQEEKYAGMSVDAARKHRDVILKFGRFPSRNEILGRETTEEERKHLDDNPSGF